MNFWFGHANSEDDLRIIHEEHGAFQSALGALTLNWADLEKVLRRTLRHYAGVSHEVARALFSGTRAKGAIAFINSIAHNLRIEDSRAQDLKDIFEVVASINNMRDFIVHHIDGSMIESNDDDPRSRKLSDEHAASRMGKVRTVWVSSELVHDMCADITECCWRLQAHWDPTNTPFQPGVGPTGARQPWRYKPPQPVR